MRKILSILVIALLSSVGYALISSEAEYDLNHMSYAANKHGLGTLLSKNKNLLVAKYSYAVQGGSTTSDLILRRDLAVGGSAGYATLPNKAIVTNVFIDALTLPTSAGTNATISLGVVSNSDLLSAAAIGTFVNRLQGIPTGTTATMIKLSTSGDAPIKMRVAKSTAGQASPLSAGKFNVYIEYMLGD